MALSASPTCEHTTGLPSASRARYLSGAVVPLLTPMSVRARHRRRDAHLQHPEWGAVFSADFARAQARKQRTASASGAALHCKVQSTSPAPTPAVTLPPTSETHKRITNALVSMMACCSLPLSIVESNWFRCLTASLRPDYRMPDREEVRDMLAAKAAVLRSKIGGELASATTVFASYDCWSRQGPASECVNVKPPLVHVLLLMLPGVSAAVCVPGSCHSRHTRSPHTTTVERGR